MPSLTFSERRHYSHVVLRICSLLIALSVTALGQGNSSVVGNWSGAFSSRDFASFPATLKLTKNAQGQLTGTATMGHQCMTKSTLVVTVTGTEVVLAGSDAKGDTITFRGNIDSTGELLNLSFRLNGSASGRCENDEGAGSVTRQH